MESTTPSRKTRQNKKNRGILLNKSLYIFTTETILVNREILSKKQKFDNYFQEIK